jgi:16S rRNA (adenine1518-N6/adenine1519-N6)-dimethyltransferase
MPMNPYLSLARVRAALRNLNIKPTRGMGQNFLVDPHPLQQIVAAADLSPADLVVEVGPGLGVLTWELLQAAGRVITVELDRRLAARLRDEFAHQSRLYIIEGDILNLPPENILAATQAMHNERSPIQEQSDTLPPAFIGQPAYKVVANLPYAITAPVLRHFLEGTPQPQLMVVLVQWEVAQRITAAPGDLSMLAHAVQFYAEPEIVARVPASNFFPAPAVDSAILRLCIRTQSVVEVDDIDGFFRIIKASFLQPRKKLSNALPVGLAAMGQRIPREVVVDSLKTAGVAPDRRAETVTLSEWLAVWQALGKRIPQSG